ncbi:hypothetical protein OF83DRAFT_382500 [Amylostereum chailletii]|nr:hypothetical protein OF83DRAFT_382500 [Amylostereum chailletii]
MIFESIEAESLMVKNLEGTISGKFNVSDTLSLDTINAPIVADVYLFNAEKEHRPTHLSLETGNAPINASITLQVERKSFYLSRPSFPNFAIKMHCGPARMISRPRTLRLPS